jgi:formylglycine-generating enzyme
MRLRRTLALLAAVTSLGPVTVVSGCEPARLPPRGQVVLHLDTDAPLLRGGPLDPAPLFDRILVEIYEPGAAEPCDGCVRELAADADAMRGGRLSFGFLPPAPRLLGYTARLRLFRSAGRGTPRPESSIELVGYLPAVAEEGVTTLTATFRTEDVGSPRGSLDAPITFDRGARPVSLEGTWPGATVTPCTKEPPDGAVCVTGGAFFMGDPRVPTDEPRTGGAREHLVTLSPFFLDAREITVADVRASGLATLDARGRAIDPLDDARDEFSGACDYTTDVGPWEALPVVCVSWQLARRYCQARGGDLPTEAQLERVAGARGTSLAPWGAREPSCEEAVVARRLPCGDDAGTRDPFGLERRLLPEPAGTGPLDRVELPGGTILDLGANVSEWARDAFQRDDEPCWAEAHLVDPWCDAAATVRSTKGGNLDRLPVDFAQQRRGEGARDSTFHSPRVGFRCAYPAAP